MKIIKLIYIGEQFYELSKSLMSSIYTEDTHERYDWGFVNVALRNGDHVHIRPATDDELGKLIRGIKPISKPTLVQRK